MLLFWFVFQTFCVISKKYKKNYIYRFSCSKSLYLIGPLNPIRKAAIWLVTQQWFDILMIVTIIANCVTLGMTQNEYEKCEHDNITIHSEHEHNHKCGAKDQSVKIIPEYEDALTYIE